MVVSLLSILALSYSSNDIDSIFIICCSLLFTLSFFSAWVAAQIQGNQHCFCYSNLCASALNVSASTGTSSLAGKLAVSSLVISAIGSCASYPLTAANYTCQTVTYTCSDPNANSCDPMTGAPTSW